MGKASRLPPISSQRLEELGALLARLGLDPHDPGRSAGDGNLRADAAALAPIEEALTHTSSGRGRNHEQLEFLGDAVLRLAAAEYLERRHPSLSVGQRSALRAQLVSDRWLAELAEQMELAPLLRLGPVALGDASGRATVLAECCEALVGALYRLGGGSGGGLELVLRWLEPAWDRASAELLADPERHNWKTALQEWSQGSGLGLPHYRCEEMSRRHGDPRRFRARVRCGSQDGAEADQEVLALLAKPEAQANGDAPAAGSGPEEGGRPSDNRASRTPDNVAAGCFGEGWGSSRREAEQQAARAALAELRRPEGWSTAR
jgi:ribonuclease-3